MVEVHNLSTIGTPDHLNRLQLTHLHLLILGHENCHHQDPHREEATGLEHEHPKSDCNVRVIKCAFNPEDQFFV